MSHNESEVDPVVVENGTFTWDDEGESPIILKNISMRVNCYTVYPTIWDKPRQSY